MNPITTVVILVAIIAVSSCTSKKEPPLYPADFRFKLKRTSFEYDSKTQMYVYYDKSIIVALTDEELQGIYKYARDINYLRFPREFKCDGEGGTLPCFEDHLEVIYDNKYKQTMNDDCCTKIEKNRPARFDSLVKKITDILHSKEQVKKLPKYDIIYM